MIESLKSFIAKNHLVGSDEKILLACSGGIDSMVLADALIKLSYKIGIAHVDHGLRDAESDADHDFVKAFCLLHAVPFHASKLKLKEETVRAGNLQEIAREARYDFFNELCQEHGYVVIATAHHVDDNIETILHRLLRGTGIKGMAGIPVKRDNIIRPLLFATKKEITAYATENDIKYREDSSNAKNTYTRNFLRNEILPKLDSHYDNKEKRVLNSIQNFRSEYEILQSLIDEKKASFVHSNGDHYAIEKSQLAPYLHLPYFLFKLVEDFGFNKSQCEEIYRAWHDISKQFHSNKYTLVVDRSKLIIKENSLSEIPTSSIDNFPFKYSVSSNSALIFNTLEHRNIDYADYLAVFDKDKLKHPLQIGPWKEGESFKPFGMAGKSQKIKDFLVHVKHPAHAKKECLVLRSGDEIIWVIPYRISELHKVDADTKQLIVVQEIK